MLIWWMISYVRIRDNIGFWEGCEAVEGGGTCTVLSEESTPDGELIEQVQEEDLNEGSVFFFSSLEEGMEDGRARIQNEFNLDPDPDHMGEKSGNL